MSGGGSPPPAPDYVAAAREQGRQNINAARIGAQLNRVNQSGPGGSVTYSQDPNNPDQFTQTTTLSPEQQALYGSTTANAQSRADIAGQSADYLGRQLSQPIDFSGQPSRVSSIDAQPYSTSVNAPSVANRSLDFSGAPERADAAYQRQVDLSGVSPINTDFSSERQRVEDALYGRATERLDPRFAQQEEGIRSQLINQGIREGSEAWNNAMREFGNTRQDAYGDARDRAILAGGSEQSRLFADALRARQQGVSEQFGQGEFANQAAQAANAYGLNARGQAVGEATTAGEFANQAAQQEFGNEAFRTNLYNQGQDTQFSQGLANAGLTNEARDAGINESLIPRQQAMNEFMQLYGDYAGGPQAVSPGGVQGPAAPDVQGALNQQYGYQTDLYNYDQQRRSQNTQTGVQLAATLAMLLSDRRAKTDIERIGTLPSGIPTYRFRYKTDGIERLGVMSDDVREVMPEAVIVGPDGFDRVNYAMIGAAHLLEVN